MPVAIDFQAAFEDAVAIASSARSATAGWRAICVRERRRVGSKVIEPLSNLDLDEDAERIARGVREFVERAPRSVDALVFRLFDAIDDGAGRYAGYHVEGFASYGREVEDFLRDPWTPERRFLRSDALDSIVQAACRAPRDVRPLLEYSLSFGAAALTSRFATRDLAHRVVVAFDDDHGRPPPAGAPTLAEVGTKPRDNAPGDHGRGDQRPSDDRAA